MRAVVLTQGAHAPEARLGEFPDTELQGATTVRVTASCMNYKDGLAIARGAPVVRRWPMIPGIECAGVVEASDDPALPPGTAVLLQGNGLGETHLGAYAERVRVPSDWPIPMPSGFDAEGAMAVGVAGFTAMLSILALERHGLSPASGPVLVTGASGGAGSVAVALLAKLGWHVLASTGRPGEADYLRGLGAAEIMDRAELSAPSPRPLQKERWAAAIDGVGSHTLVNALAGTRADGAVAAFGLAQGMDLPGSVAPFILRGVALLGINSVYTPRALRIAAWERLGTDLDRARLATMTEVIGLDDVIATAPRFLAGEVRGRVVVRMPGTTPAGP